MNSDSNIEIFKTEDNETIVEVKLDNDTVWLTQKDIGNLFGKDRTTINRHINNIFNDNELYEKEVCAEFAHTTNHGAISNKTETNYVKNYNLNMIISVGTE